MATYQDLDEVTLEEAYLKKRNIFSKAPDDHTEQPSDMKMNTDEVTLVYAVGCKTFFRGFLLYKSSECLTKMS